MIAGRLLGTTTLLSSASLAIGVPLGLLYVYSTGLGLSSASMITVSGYPVSTLAAQYTTLALTLPVTLAVFYMIGRRCRSGYVTGGNLLAIYGGVLVGEILGQTTAAIAGISSSSGITSGPPLSFSVAPYNSLSFLFVAFSGFALSNLPGAGTGPTSLGRGPLLTTFAAFVFGAEGSLYLGAITLNGGLVSIYQFSLLYVIAFPAQLVAFYVLGRRYPISRRTFRYFGQLFLGLFVGSAVGGLVSVALFGQNSWTVAPGSGSLSFVEGIEYHNVAPSLQVLIEALNPLASLPFISFFAMALSRTKSSLGSPTNTEAEPLPSLAESRNPSP